MLMKNKYYKKIILSVSILFFIFFAGAVSAGSGNLSDAFKVGDNGQLGGAASEMGYKAGVTPESVVATIVQIVLGLLGVVFVFFLVYGGIQWMVAGGNDEQIKKAQSIIKRAIVGLIITLAAYIVSVFIISVFVSPAGPGGQPVGEPMSEEEFVQEYLESWGL
jgi:amino acid transporter